MELTWKKRKRRSHHEQIQNCKGSAGTVRARRALLAQAAPLSRHNLGDEELLRVNACCSP